MSAPAKRKSLAAAIQDEAYNSMRCEEDESVVEEALIEHDQATKKKQKTAETEHEEQKESDTSCLAVIPPGLLVGVPRASAAPVDLLFVDHENQASIGEQFLATYKAMQPLVKRGMAKVRNPDLFMCLASAALNLKLSMTELDNPKVQFNVFRSGKYLNFGCKKPSQRDPDGNSLLGFNFVTAAFKPMYSFKYGSTVETGLEGNKGKVMDVKKTGKKISIKRGEEHYDVTIGCEPIHPDMVDSNANNPFALGFLDSLHVVKKFVFDKIWAKQENMVTMRQKLQTMVDKKMEDKMPASGAEAMAMLLKHEAYLEKLVVSEGDESFKSLTLSESVYRQPRRESSYTGAPAEDISAYKAPSEMFEKNFQLEKDVDGESRMVTNLWRDLKAWRVRRPNEFVAGQKYASPFIRIPKENVAFNKNDVLFAIFQLGFYEASAKDECAYKHQLVGFIWLTTVAQMEQFVLEDVVPCNPLHGNPYAGYYKGPRGWEGEAPEADLPVSKSSDDLVLGEFNPADFE